MSVPENGVLSVFYNLLYDVHKKKSFINCQSNALFVKYLQNAIKYPQHLKGLLHLNIIWLQRSTTKNAEEKK